MKVIFSEQDTEYGGGKVFHITIESYYITELLSYSYTIILFDLIFIHI